MREEALNQDDLEESRDQPGNGDTLRPAARASARFPDSQSHNLFNGPPRPKSEDYHTHTHDRRKSAWNNALHEYASHAIHSGAHPVDNSFPGFAPRNCDFSCCSRVGIEESWWTTT